jgi:hypothetical protein
MPRLRMSGPVPLLHLYVFVAWTGAILRYLYLGAHVLSFGSVSWSFEVREQQA